jgi:hypothetical protein
MTDIDPQTEFEAHALNLDGFVAKDKKHYPNVPHGYFGITLRRWETWQAAVAAESARREGERCVWTKGMASKRDGTYVPPHAGAHPMFYTWLPTYCPDCGKRIEIKEAP